MGVKPTRLEDHVQRAGAAERIEVRVLRVFTDERDMHGNPLGVVCAADAIPPQRRQEIAAELGYSETVFVQQPARIAIHTPTVELPFAGHPTVGAAWLLRARRLLAAVGTIECSTDAHGARVLARAEWAPPFERRELPSAEAVDALPAPVSGNVQAWAWLDEPRGIVRARVFAPDIGVGEDSATGSAAVALADALGREITIVQGPGCVIEARPAGDGLVELSGRVADDGLRLL